MSMVVGVIGYSAIILLLGAALIGIGKVIDHGAAIREALADAKTNTE